MVPPILQFLQAKPGVPASSAVLEPDAFDLPEEERLFCANCGHLVTLGRWRMAMNGAHEHTVFNPAGVVFTLHCFRDALGIRMIGPFSEEFSWFKGYAWQITLCAGCGTHVGWRYAGEAEEPRGFFGFVKDRLTATRPASA